ncbi:unnamed protein product [Microthlaspi erraticum]|uniref:Uncharacterized protein n=1 Tax=Microthlaspi erraticum TaxID=1685480 RepID=A0A6D2J342_9BRAS|nr:unnamed protein product [Microthlaspi erraticum]
MKWYIQGLVFGYLSAPQRTGRLGRGLEMVDGHQEHSMQLGCLTRSSLRLLLFSSSSSKCVAPLALVELCLLEAVVGVQLVWEKSWYCVDRTRIQGSQTGAPPGQLDPQLDRVEFPLFGLDRVRWSSWSVWPWKSSSFSACCLLLPLARKKRLCEALGQGASLECHNRGVHPWSLILLKVIALRLTQIRTLLDSIFSLISARSSARSSSGSSSRKSLHAQLSVHRGSEVNVLPLDRGELRVGQEKLGGSSQWMVNLNWNLPSNSLCSMRRLVLQNLMSIQPGVAFSCLLQLHRDRCDDPPTLSFFPLMPSVVGCVL